MTTTELAVSALGFNYGEREVRVVVQNDGPWFVAKDVCDVLGTDTRNVRKTLDEDEVDSIHVQDRRGSHQEMLIVSEAGLYALILRSRKRGAKPFQRWIAHEVLPSIRKHGAYLTPQKIEEALLNPDTIIQLATRKVSGVTSNLTEGGEAFGGG